LPCGPMAGVVRGLMRCEVSICKLRIRASFTNKQVVPWGFMCRGGMPVSSLPISLPALGAVSPGSAAGFANPAVDPARPKRPASAWIHFLSDFRKKNNGIPAKEVMTSASKAWKVMTVQQKKPFQETYDAAKKVYDVDQEEYVKWTRDPEKPKKPTSPFFLFLNGYRKKNESLKTTDASKLAAAIWNDMSKEQKQPYEKPYAEEKTKYDEALKLYKASGKEDVWREKTGKTIAGRKAKTAKKGK